MGDCARAPRASTSVSWSLALRCSGLRFPFATLMAIGRAGLDILRVAFVPALCSCVWHRQ
jgi:hypothetical protein